MSVPSTSSATTKIHEKPISRLKQTTVSSYMRKKTNAASNKVINTALMQMFIHDFQSFSVVEDYDFKQFVSALNTLLLPTLYKEAVNETATKLEEALYVTITTDTWTSRNNESFLAITAHFINKEFEIKSSLLDCSVLNESHTIVNLAAAIQSSLNKWKLQNKILMTYFS